ncbi:MAG TPA: TolC family protein [Myxococcales bacterium]|nr:TolC family protein [Myxococcales bacterium]
MLCPLLALAMTLPQALEYARAHQPDLAAARARLTAAQADARIPGSAYLPRIAATVQALEGTANNTTTSYFGSPGVDIPRIGGTKTVSDGVWNPEPSTMAALGIRQEVFDFGRVAALSAAADALVDAQREGEKSVKLDVDTAVVESFVAVNASHSILEAAQASFKRAQAHADLAQAGVGSGLRAPIERTRALADLARAQIGVVRAQGGLSSAQAVFAAAVGTPEAVLDAAGDQPPVRAEPTLEEAVRTAIDHDPQLRAFDAQLRADRARTDAIAGELRPDLSLTATLSGRAGGSAPTAGSVPTGDGWLPVVPNWDVGLILSWPLFDRTVTARRDASTARTQADAAVLQSARDRLTAQVQQAVLELHASREAVPALEAAERAARDNQAQADARFRAGLGTSTELADAEALLTDAQIQLAVGRFSVSRAGARLGRVLAEVP